MEQRQVHPVHKRNLAATTVLAVCLAGAEFFGQITPRVTAAVRLVPDLIPSDIPTLFDISGALGAELVFLVPMVRRGGGAVAPTNFGHAENGLPSPRNFAPRARGIPKSPHGQGAFGPSVVDAGEVPVHFIRRGVFVQLIADVDQDLHRRDIDVVHRGEIQNDGLERGAVRMIVGQLATSGTRIIPRTILSIRTHSD